MRTVDSDFGYSINEDEIKQESPVDSLMRSADFWEKSIGKEKFKAAPIIAQLLRNLAQRYPNLSAIKQSVPSSDYAVIIQLDQLIADENGNFFFRNIDKALDHIDYKSEGKHPPSSLVFPFSDKGLSPNVIWSIGQQQRFIGKNVWSMYPVPQHIVESGS